MRRLEKIRNALHDGSFRFSPGRGVPIERPGKDVRPIVVQDVADRVVQRSLLDVVMSGDKVKRAVITETSFGGVPGRGVQDAIQPVVDSIRSGAARYYVRSDIKAFFKEMPRRTALERLIRLLPDDSLDEFLDVATQTELSNHRALGHLLDWFPDDITGVPQGHALSALLGNILLGEFDQEINSREVRGIRYLDDFLILAPSKSAAHDGFRRGAAVLGSLGLECYAPREGGKAAEGDAQKLFEFLGCEVSRGFVRPSKANRKKLIGRVRDALQTSNRAMTTGGFSSADSYGQSVSETLSRVSRTLRGWAEQYSFCNYGVIKADMDSTIDELLAEYLGTYADRRRRADSLESRRMVGVWLVQDTAEEPLW